MSSIFLIDDTFYLALASFLNKSNMQISKYKMKLQLHLKKVGLFVVLRSYQNIFPQGEFFS